MESTHFSDTFVSFRLVRFLKFSKKKKKFIMSEKEPFLGLSKFKDPPSIPGNPGPRKTPKGFLPPYTRSFCSFPAKKDK
jgi:hypothetical protein